MLVKWNKVNFLGIVDVVVFDNKILSLLLLFYIFFYDNFFSLGWIFLFFCYF